VQEPTTRFDHVAVTVHDMERSVGFYRDLLGFEVVGQLLLDDDTFKIVYLRPGRRTWSCSRSAARRPRLRSASPTPSAASSTSPCRRRRSTRSRRG
jgi:catechol 2,3-dioxygenase-like lactoylglutathione lyase family enzyme